MLRLCDTQAPYYTHNVCIILYTFVYILCLSLGFPEGKTMLDLEVSRWLFVSVVLVEPMAHLYTLRLCDAQHLFIHTSCVHFIPLCLGSLGGRCFLLRCCRVQLCIFIRLQYARHIAIYCYTQVVYISLPSC